MAKTPQQVSDEITVLVQEAGGEISPEKMTEILDRLYEFTDLVNAIETNAYIKGDIEGPAHVSLRQHLQNWYDLLGYYQKAAKDAHGQGPEAIFQTITSPLLYGLCYGSPSCSQKLADQWAPSGFPTAPKIQEPFIILSATGAAEQASMQNTFVKAVKDVFTEAAKDVVEALTPTLPGLEDLKMPPWAWALVGVLGLATVVALVRSPS